MARSVLEVFLSSTAKDLTAYRDAIYQRLQRNKFHCIRFEDFGAQDAEAVAYCCELAAKADFFVGVIGLRRGYEPSGDDAQRSITEMEYDAATQANCRTYLWVSPEDFSVPGNLRENDSEYARQLAFRKRVGKQIVSQKGFTSPEALASEVIERLLMDRIEELERPEREPQPTKKQRSALRATIEKLTDEDVDLLAPALATKDAFGALSLLGAKLPAYMRAWLPGRHDVSFVHDERFVEKCRALLPETGTIQVIDSSVVTFDAELNRALSAVRTPIVTRESLYALPKPLSRFQGYALRFRNPTMNEEKIRLASDLKSETIRSGRAVELRRTSYFLGIASNELGDVVIEQVDRKQQNIESLSVFDLYVAQEGRLVPLSRSALSNHIGVTSLVITSDNCVVLQWQGSTQVDSNKLNAGGSGSADWDDIEAARLLKRPRSDLSLQDLVRYAMEREVYEELGAKVGPGHSSTAITGFTRYVHRGGKPEFFGFTCLKQDFASLAIPHNEEKWVRALERRQMDGNSVASLLRVITMIEAEFDPHKTTRASISLVLALRFAREFLLNNPDYQLRPNASTT